MLQFLSKVFNREYQPLNSISISAQNLFQNYHYLSSTSSLCIAPVLKSNAYGHGLVMVAKLLDTLKPPFFCVDSLYEGYELLKAGIKSPILIMGYVRPNHLKVKRLPFLYAAYDLEFLKAVSKHQPQAKVHLFVDTGMHREGIRVEELEGFLQQTRQIPNLIIDGLMSHFAAAHNTNSPGTQHQVEMFTQARTIVKEQGIHLTWEHIAASNGILHCRELDNLGNCGRAGLTLYGLDPEGENRDLKPALKLSTTLVQMKMLKEGETVGYDFSYTAPKRMLLGVLPIGYNDGVDRRLSNCASVTISGTVCPIVGKISMNITTIDISNLPNPQIGDEVIVYDCEENAPNSVRNTAKQCKTIPYELFVHLHPSTKRFIC